MSPVGRTRDAGWELGVRRTAAGAGPRPRRWGRAGGL